MPIEALFSLAQEVGDRLRQREETVAVIESSSGGLISAALLSVPGASAFYLGAAVVYTPAAREVFLNIDRAAVRGIRSATEPYARLLAEATLTRFDCHWALTETGASGPTGNSHGDAPGHCCLALACSDPARGVQSLTLETENDDRVTNMVHFATRGLQLLDEQLRD